MKNWLAAFRSIDRRILSHKEPQAMRATGEEPTESNFRKFSVFGTWTTKSRIKHCRGWSLGAKHWPSIHEFDTGVCVCTCARVHVYKEPRLASLHIKIINPKDLKTLNLGKKSPCICLQEQATDNADNACFTLAARQASSLHCNAPSKALPEQADRKKHPVPLPWLKSKIN